MFGGPDSVMSLSFKRGLWFGLILRKELIPMQGWWLQSILKKLWVTTQSRTNGNRSRVVTVTQNAIGTKPDYRRWLYMLHDQKSSLGSPSLILGSFYCTRFLYCSLNAHIFHHFSPYCISFPYPSLRILPTKCILFSLLNEIHASPQELSSIQNLYGSVNCSVIILYLIVNIHFGFAHSV